MKITHYHFGYWVEPDRDTYDIDIHWRPTRRWAEFTAKRLLTQYTTGTVPKETWYVED